MTEEAKRIAIVEDENIVALDIRMHVQKFGHSVVGTYVTGEELLAAFPGIKPDLVLMDIKLQGKLDGVETASIIKERYHIPVVLLTAYADETTLERAKITEPFGYIIKPFEERELKTAIVMALYRYTMQRELREREALYSTIFCSIVDAVIVLDESSVIKYLNPVAERFFGTPRDRILGQKMMDFPWLQAMVQTRSAQSQNYYEMRLSEDVVRFVEITISDLANANSETHGQVIAIHDISERVSAEKELLAKESQLRQSQKLEAVGRLAGGIAHDFNNLLTIIMGYSRLILDDDEVALEVKSNIEGIQQAALKSVSLTKQLLAFSRHQPVARVIIDVNNFLYGMQKLIRRLVGEDTVLSWDFAASPSRIFIDQSQLEQVIINLVANARDAMERSPVLAIRTAVVNNDSAMRTRTGLMPKGTYINISIQDNGIGIGEETATKIFEPFFTTKESGRGTGLGLSTVYGIVKQNNGFINFESELGRGTTFHVLFPAATGAEKSETRDNIEKKQLEGKERILVVEDEEGVRNLLVRILRSYGYTVFEAEGAGDALLIAEEETKPIDVLVTDLILPHLSGVELYKRSKNIHKDIRPLYISGYPEQTIRERHLLEDLSMFLQKPFSPEAFLTMLRKVLGNDNV